MNVQHNSPSASLTSPGRSIVWEIYVPLAAATLPAGLFTLLGAVNGRFDQPGGKPPGWLIVTAGGLQVLGIIAMAIVILVRFEIAARVLSIRTGNRPAAWRQRTLVVSIFFLLLFDLLTNVAAAFTGAGFLLLAAGPAFLAYVALGRIALAGTSGKAPEGGSRLQKEAPGSRPQAPGI